MDANHGSLNHVVSQSRMAVFAEAHAKRNYSPSRGDKCSAPAGGYRSHVRTMLSPSPFQTIDRQSAATSPRNPARALDSRLRM